MLSSSLSHTVFLLVSSTKSHWCLQEVLATSGLQEGVSVTALWPDNGRPRTSRRGILGISLPVPPARCSSRRSTCYCCYCQSLEPAAERQWEIWWEREGLKAFTTLWGLLDLSFACLVGLLEGILPSKCLLLLGRRYGSEVAVSHSEV